MKIAKAIKQGWEKFLIDGVKRIIEWLVKVIWNWIGISVLVLISSALLVLAKWLAIPISVPAYLVAITIAVLFLGALLVARYKKALAEERQFEFWEGFAWRLSEKGVAGPFCPKCYGVIACESEQGDLDEQLSGVADLFLGGTSSYVYFCQQCDFKAEKDLSLSELQRYALQALKKT